MKFRSHKSEIREKYNFHKFIIFYSGIIERQVFESNYFHFTCIISKVENYFFSLKFQKLELKIIEKLCSLSFLMRVNPKGKSSESEMKVKQFFYTFSITI